MRKVNVKTVILHVVTHPIDLPTAYALTEIAMLKKKKNEMPSATVPRNSCVHSTSISPKTFFFN